MSLKFYIKPKAFRKASSISSKEDDGSAKRTGWWDKDGQMTEQERILQNRMSSLLTMFNVLGLRPRKQSAIFTSNRGAKLIDDTGEEEEELSDNQLDLIYKK